MKILKNKTLKQGELYTSANEKACLSFQTDGNLVIYEKDGKGKYTTPLWSVGDYDDRYGTIKAVTLQTDGNLVAYKTKTSFKSENAIWAIGSTHQKEMSELSITDAGFLNFTCEKLYDFG